MLKLEEWLTEAQRLEDQGRTEQAEQIRAKDLGYEYLSPKQLEIIKQMALDPGKKENEVKKERQDKIGTHYLLSVFFQNNLQKMPQTATRLTLSRFWWLVNPNSLAYETRNRQFLANSHSMVYFLIMLFHCLNELHPNKVIYKKGTPDEKTMAIFKMDDMVRYTELMPDEILPPYRKKRQYINSVLSSNEMSRAGFSNCKMTFIRVERGAYILNHEINWL